MRRRHRPDSTHNRELYEELRNEGASDEKAQRIADSVAAAEREAWGARQPVREAPRDPVDGD